MTWALVQELGLCRPCLPVHCAITGRVTEPPSLSPSLSLQTMQHEANSRLEHSYLRVSATHRSTEQWAGHGLSEGGGISNNNNTSNTICRVNIMCLPILHCDTTKICSVTCGLNLIYLCHFLALCSISISPTHYNQWQCYTGYTTLTLISPLSYFQEEAETQIGFILVTSLIVCFW